MNQESEGPDSINETVEDQLPNKPVSKDKMEKEYISFGLQKDNKEFPLYL